MRLLSCVAVVGLGFAGLCCGDDYANGPIRGELTLDVKGNGSSAKAGNFDAKAIYCAYDAGDQKPGTDAGYSFINMTPGPDDTTTCKGATFGFVGKPEAGKHLQLAYVRDGADGGVNEFGITVQPYANGFATLTYSEGCGGPGDPVQTWRSTGGTLNIQTISDPPEMPDNAVPGTVKWVTVNMESVQLTSEGAPATGNPTLTAGGALDFFEGMGP